MKNPETSNVAAVFRKRDSLDPGRYIEVWWIVFCRVTTFAKGPFRIFDDNRRMISRTYLNPINKFNTIYKLEAIPTGKVLQRERTFDKELNIDV